MPVGITGRDGVQVTVDGDAAKRWAQAAVAEGGVPDLGRALALLLLEKQDVFSSVGPEAYAWIPADTDPEALAFLRRNKDCLSGEERAVSWQRCGAARSRRCARGPSGR